MKRQIISENSEPRRGLRARVAERGQVVVPKALRDRIGLRPGEQLEFTEERGRLIAVRIPSTVGLDRAFGMFGRPGSTDELVDALRGKAEPVRQSGRRRRAQRTIRSRPR